MQYLLIDIVCGLVAFASAYIGATIGYRMAMRRVERAVRTRKTVADLVDHLTREMRQNEQA
jgi:hypothetical protein